MEENKGVDPLNVVAQEQDIDNANDGQGPIDAPAADEAPVDQHHNIQVGMVRTLMPEIDHVLLDKYNKQALLSDPAFGKQPMKPFFRTFCF